MTYGYGDEREDWRQPVRPQPPGAWPPVPAPAGPRHGQPEDGYETDAVPYDTPPPAAQRPPQPAQGHVYGRRAATEPEPQGPAWDEPPYPPSGPATYPTATGYPAAAGYPAPPPTAPPPQSPPVNYHGTTNVRPTYDGGDGPGRPPHQQPPGYGRSDGYGYPAAPRHAEPQQPWAEAGYPPGQHTAGGGYGPGAPGPMTGQPPAPGGYPHAPGYPGAPGRQGYAAVPPDHRPTTYHPSAAHPGGRYGLDAPPAYPPDRGYPTRPGTAVEPAYVRDPEYPTNVYGQQTPGTALDDRLARTPARTGRLTWADEQPALESGAPAPRRRRRGRTVAITIALVLVLLGATSVAVFWLNERRASGEPVAQPTPSVDTRSIADRKVDPAPLTANEVFGHAKINSTAQGGGSYQVMGSDISKTCAGAVTGEISTLMTSLGCDQVVRGTMFSPDRAYVITAGIFNLPDANAATKAFNSIRTDINAAKGRFVGLGAGSGTDIVTSAQAHLAWEARGHYLTYCVIVLANGKPIPASDTRAPLIVTDVLERYLGDTVLGARDKHVVVPPSPSGSHS